MSLLPQHNPDDDEPADSSRRRWKIGGILFGVVLLLLLIIRPGSGSKNEVAAASLFEVQRGPLTISIKQPGTIKNREQAKVLCEVPGETRILWLIEEGKYVEADDLLISLDSNRFEEQLVEQQIVLENAEAAAIRAKESLEVKHLDMKGEVAKAELTLELAELDLNAYEEEEYPQAIQKAETEITLAAEEIQRADDKVKWSATLAEEGYVTRSELQADELAAKRVRLNQKLAEGNLRTLKQFSNARKLQQLKAQISNAERSLERITHTQKAQVVQAETDLRARDSELVRQQKKLETVKENIANCTIKAPVPGMVVYSTTGQGQRRGREEPLAEGGSVRERQHLISLPTAASMMADVRIHESSIRKIKEGLPVVITVDALPGRAFTGSVAKIGLLPDAQMSWLNSNLKVYNSQVHIDGDAEGLRPGMNCMVEVVVEQYEAATYVPLQSVVKLKGADVAYVPGRDGPEPRTVEVGLNNNRMVRILSGLEPGESVYLAPPLDGEGEGDTAEEEVVAEMEEPENGDVRIAREEPGDEPVRIAREEPGDKPARIGREGKGRNRPTSESL